MKRPITEDEYRVKISNNATDILNALLDYTPASFRDLNSLNILVIGSGFFPSFLPLQNSLQRLLPALNQLNFILIEPIKSETDRFQNYYSDLDSKIDSGVTINIEIHNQDIKEYLMQVQNTVFDLIYFEQPDLFPLSVLLAKKGVAHAILDVSLRESIPYLKKVIGSESIIMASFLFKHDLKQLNSLINFSLNIKTHLEYLPKLFSNGVPYCSGLISIVDQANLHDIHPEKVSAAIQINDSVFCVLLIASIIIFILTASWAKPLSIFITISLLLYHRYGLGNLIVKLILIAVQLFILTGVTS